MTQGSLFDGFGGIRRGLEDAGFDTKWFKDIIYGNDIRTEEPDQLDSVDLISGGPPCTRTSMAASWHKQRDYASLWSEMLRVVGKKLPKWVLVEQPAKGGEVIISQAAIDLQRIGYGCSGRIIDSRHWVPQTRSRWVLIGRLGISGLDLWNRLYPDSIGMEGKGRTYKGARSADSLGHVPTVCEAEFIQGFLPGSLHSWARETHFHNLSLDGLGNKLSERKGK